jgi:hypothetical protein
MTRSEVRDLRARRLLEQAALAAAESQCSRLSAALSCAEDDLKTLSSALGQESRRASAWMVRNRRLFHSLQAHKNRPLFDDEQERAQLLERDLLAQREEKRAERSRRAAARLQSLSRPAPIESRPVRSSSAGRPAGRRVSIDPMLGDSRGGNSGEAGVDGSSGDPWACGISASVGRRARSVETGSQQLGICGRDCA